MSDDEGFDWAAWATTRLEELVRIRKHLEKGEQMRQRRVELFRELHDAGVPWTEIGAIAGVTGDAVLRAVKRDDARAEEEELTS